MEIFQLIVLFLSLGLVVGFAGGLFGIGGGIILIPVFMLVFPLIGVKEVVLMHVALGTSVALLGPNALAASFKQYRLGNLDIKFYRTWAIWVALGVTIGLLILPKISTRELKLLFAIFLLFAVPFLFLAKRTESDDVDSAPTGVVKFLTGFAIGIGSILTGTGGSTFTVPSLIALGVPIRKTIAISSATAPVVSAIGTLGFVYHGMGVPDRPPFSIGYVDSLVFLCMLPTIFIGAPLGVKVGNAMDKQLLQRLFGILILIIALHTLYHLYG